MKDSHINLCLIAILIIVSGLILDFKASSAELEFSQISRFGEAGEKIVENVVSVPKNARILTFVASALNASGISILISILVISRVEESQKDSLNRELFSSVFKRMIPEELFTVIYDDILRSPVIQRDSHWHLNYSILADSDILLTRTATYTLHNISNQPFEDSMKSMFVKKAEHESIGLVRAQWKSNGIVVVDYDAEKPGMDKGVEKSEQGGKTYLSYPISIPAGGQVSATLVIKSTSKRGANDAMFGNRPIMDLRVTANFPERMKFSYHPSTSSKIECLDSGSTSASLKACGAILPKQGIIFMLEPTEITVTETEKPEVTTPPSGPSTP
ncbi:hypothetical protein [Actomonas aquatica]|uniref:Uncharacterized protein n=1 Tax=Actomonas aquatica TaxID=2866162 RepID=A0ABZ1C3E4_9BACT|nr:hypothetical protein [Opitutus sp. WL0086]WRQ85966.1 hypothetical protein K1X11_014225 [Opitutus sp. WL0086]